MGDRLDIHKNDIFLISNLKLLSCKISLIHALTLFNSVVDICFLDKEFKQSLSKLVVGAWLAVTHPTTNFEWLGSHWPPRHSKKLFVLILN